MLAWVVPMQRHGVDLTQKEIRAYKGHNGDVHVMCVMDKRLGRATNIAELQPPMPMQTVELPALCDARLTGMSTMGYTLIGFQIMSPVHQGWWVWC